MTAYDQRKSGQIVSAVRFRPQPHPYFIGKTGGKHTPFGHPVEPLGNERKYGFPDAKASCCVMQKLPFSQRRKGRV